MAKSKYSSNDSKTHQFHKLAPTRKEVKFGDSFYYSDRKFTKLKRKFEEDKGSLNNCSSYNQVDYDKISTSAKSDDEYERIVAAANKTAEERRLESLTPLVRALNLFSPSRQQHGSKALKFSSWKNYTFNYDEEYEIAIDDYKPTWQNRKMEIAKNQIQNNCASPTLPFNHQSYNENVSNDEAEEAVANNRDYQSLSDWVNYLQSVKLGPYMVLAIWPCFCIPCLNKTRPFSKVKNLIRQEADRTS